MLQQPQKQWFTGLQRLGKNAKRNSCQRECWPEMGMNSMRMLASVLLPGVLFVGFALFLYPRTIWLWGG